ncbi:MAG: hypothetical protein WCG81_12795 [Candidatus Angelobacter sp.]
MPPLVRAVLLLLAVLSSHIALADETSGLTMDFRTTSGSTVFHIGEVIPIQVSFSSTKVHRYLAPCNLFWHPGFGFPQCYFVTPWQFTITPAQGWQDRRLDLIPLTDGGPTFDVATRNLTREPVMNRETLSDLVRFSQPGKYKVRQTVEIALDDHKPQHKPGDGPKTKTVTVSSELAIRIVPVDTDWEQEIIRKGVETFSACRNPDVQPENREAAKAFCYLGTPNAALAQAHLAIHDRAGYGCFARSPNVETGVQEMQRLLVDPETPVSSRFFELLVGLLNRAESPRYDMMIVSQKIVDEQREVLFQALPRKQGGARIISLMAVLANPPRVLPVPAGITHFQEPVIATLVENWNDLPEDFKARLLDELWLAVRLPLLLPILRSRAETGDQIALQRWMEMDPESAREFLKRKN